ncbi:MAG: DNA repair protein RecN [Thermomicrobiales bacterium]
MLVELSITDFAIIDELHIPVEPGLNALTGETGAGKSIIIDALSAVLGERVGPDVVRTGAKQARVEATFDMSQFLDRPDFLAALEDHGIEADEGTLILSREISATGRSSARINGRAATVGSLERVGSLLVDIHGQSDHLSLLHVPNHLGVLDRFAGLEPVRDEFGQRVHDLRLLQTRINEIESGSRELAHRSDLLTFQLREIEDAKLTPGEDEDLENERSVLVNAERLSIEAERSYALLAGDEELPIVDSAPMPALTALRQVCQELASISAVDESMTGLSTRAQEQLFLLEDIAAELRDYREGVEANPARLEQVEDRLDAIRLLKKKYGPTIEEILAFGQRCQIELESLTGAENDIESLREREALLREELGNLAVELSRTRKQAGERLAQATEKAIAALNLGRASFAVSIRQHESPGGVPFEEPDGGKIEAAFDATGADRVEFLLAPNAGEALKPLARVASGGEMARLMLALKSILATADATPTLVFDEVDVGVGGRSGQVVGEKLWGLAHDHQVLVITHLPQIAAFASTHFRIAKGDHDGRVTTHLDIIEAEDRIDELAQMLDGLPVTDASRANAKSMLARVEALKSSPASQTR